MRVRRKPLLILLAPIEFIFQVLIGVWEGAREACDTIRSAWRESTW